MSTHDPGAETVLRSGCGEWVVCVPEPVTEGSQAGTLALQSVGNEWVSRFLLEEEHAAVKCAKRELGMKFARIRIVPAQMGGIPCVRGLRIPVATAVGMVADGMSQEEILAAYPDLEAEDIREALQYAAEVGWEG